MKQHQYAVRLVQRHPSRVVYQRETKATELY